MISDQAEVLSGAEAHILMEKAKEKVLKKDNQTRKEEKEKAPEKVEENDVH